MVSGLIAGAFDSRTSAHSRRTLNLSSLVPATILYRRPYNLKIVLLANLCVSTLLATGELDSKCLIAVLAPAPEPHSTRPRGSGEPFASDLRLVPIRGLLRLRAHACQVLDVSRDFEPPLLVWCVAGRRHGAASGEREKPASLPSASRSCSDANFSANASGGARLTQMLRVRCEG